MVSAAYYLTVADIKNAGVAVNRDAAVVPVIAYQAFMSIVFRLEVSNFDDSQVALATCLLQGVLEVVMRLTAPERDAWVKRVSRRFGCGTRERRGTTLVVTSVAPASQGQPSSALAKTSERIAAADERDAVIKQFRARMILVDMWAELAGIIIGSLVLFLGQRMPLFYPFRPYRKHPELFDGGNYYGELAVGTVVQIVIEIITDTVCLVFEARRGLAPLAVWRELPFAALTPIVLFVLMFATLAGQMRSLYGDSVGKCNWRDVCWCVGDGLQPGGVREGYCLLLYPNSSGIPTPSTSTAAPTLACINAPYPAAYPECDARVQWLVLNWKTSQWSSTYIAGGVDGSKCSVLRFLSTVERFCAPCAC